MSGIRYKIEKDVPIPKLKNAPLARHRNAAYPLHLMNIGDSFLVPFDGFAANMIPPRLRNAICRFRHTFDPTREFTYRTLTNGVRVWRLQ